MNVEPANKTNTTKQSRPSVRLQLRRTTRRCAIGIKKEHQKTVETFGTNLRFRYDGCLFDSLWYLIKNLTLFKRGDEYYIDVFIDSEPHNTITYLLGSVLLVLDYYFRQLDIYNIISKLLIIIERIIRKFQCARVIPFTSVYNYCAHNTVKVGELKLRGG